MRNRARVVWLIDAAVPQLAGSALAGRSGAMLASFGVLLACAVGVADAVLPHRASHSNRGSRRHQRRRGAQAGLMRTCA